MSDVDVRLIELFDTLHSVGMTWLVAEVIEGITAGKRRKETSGELAEVRKIVQGGKRIRNAELPTSQEISLDTIRGDDQVEWAVQYISDRLESTVSYLQSSINNLEEIGEDGKTFKLILAIDEEPSVSVDRVRINSALEDVAKLKKHLSAWADDVRRNGIS